MIFVIITGLIAFVVVALFLFLARRVFRLALKLSLVGAMVLLIVITASVGWWRGWFGSSRPTAKPQRPTPQATQRPNSNRRPSR
jgi:multisubunit Na+/H+ antiporter MnhC subunit